MDLHLDRERLDAALDLSIRQLVAQRNAGGSWHGRLSSSPLATAAAVAALAVAERHVDDQPRQDQPGHDAWLSGVLFRTELTELVIQSLRWLAERQNPDGGWSDCDQGPSTLPATVMVQTAFQLTGVPAKYADMSERCESFVAARGGVLGLRSDTEQNSRLAACVMAAAADADLVPWRRVPALRVEQVLLPLEVRSWLATPCSARWTAPTLAMGLAKARLSPSRDLAARLLRRAARPRALATLAAMQNQPGDFHQSPLRTSLTVIGLAAAGAANDWIVRRGVEFLFSAVRSDGSWAAESNQSVLNTAQAAAALNWNWEHADASSEEPGPEALRSLQWLLEHQLSDGPQHGKRRTGWASSDDPRELPNNQATAQALLALAEWRQRWPKARTSEVQGAATAAAVWLLASQHADGAWGCFPPNRHASDDPGSPDATALVLRALAAFDRQYATVAGAVRFAPRLAAALGAGKAYLALAQRSDGSWLAKLSGDPAQNVRSNVVLGTAGGLEALVELEESHTAAAARAASWLAANQFVSGGWGSVTTNTTGSSASNSAPTASTPTGAQPTTVEETAAGLRGLAQYNQTQPTHLRTAKLAAERLCGVALSGEPIAPAPLGFSLDRLWQAEELAPKVLMAEGLRAAREAVIHDPALGHALAATG